MDDKHIYKFAFCGKMGSGKTTAAEAAFHIYRNRYGPDNVYAGILKFAQPLYEARDSLHIDFKPRTFLQRYGDLCREEFGDDIFERVFELRFNKLLQERIPSLEEKHILFMCDDLRFKGEQDLLNKLNFKIIRIDADDEVRKERLAETFVNTSHRSEQELIKIKPDVVIVNNHSPMDFYAELEKVV